MKVYLAAAWHRKKEMKALSLELNMHNIQVNSRWLDENTEGKVVDKDYLKNNALNDLDDVRTCDVLVRFTDEEFINPTAIDGEYCPDTEYVPKKLLSGARLVEMGYALAFGKKVIVVGGHQPIFDYLPQVLHVKDVTELKHVLSGISFSVGGICVR